jgi:N-acetylmuramoyl-L-alanine amidase
MYFSEKCKKNSTTENPRGTAKTVVKTQAPEVKTKSCIDHGVDFFTTNIADPTKNDNTASYGSIVSAKPAGYKVVKTYFPAVAQNFRQRYLIITLYSTSG